MHHFMCVQNQGFGWNDSQRGPIPRRPSLPPSTHACHRTQARGTSHMPIPPVATKMVLQNHPNQNRCWWLRALGTLPINRRWVYRSGRKEDRIGASSTALEPRNAVTSAARGVYPRIPNRSRTLRRSILCRMLDRYGGDDERALDEASRDDTTSRLRSVL